VYQVTDESTGEQFALKKINISNKETFALIKNEIDTWKKVSTSDQINIVKFIDASQDKQNSCIYIVSELCTGGTLFDLLTKFNGKLTEA
jgi:serine/threonine protein kinase